MPAFDAFWKGDGYFEFPVPEEAKKYTRFSEYRADPIANALGTPSGKIEIFSLAIEKFGYDDCPPHPTWIEPTEWLGSEKAASTRCTSSPRIQNTGCIPRWTTPGSGIPTRWPGVSFCG